MNIKRKVRSGAKGKLYTYSVSVSFDMQFTFTEKEVEQAEEGSEKDLDPTEKALSKLETELMEYLSLAYHVKQVEAFADFESLLGVVRL